MRMLRVSLALAFIASLGIVGTTHAARESAEPTIVYASQGPMTLDCAHASNTAAARAIMARNGLCGYGSKAAVQPFDTVCGNCGCLSVTLFNDHSGTATSLVQITSNWGPFLSASYTGDWVNWGNGASAP